MLLSGFIIFFSFHPFILMYFYVVYVEHLMSMYFYLKGPS